MYDVICTASDIALIGLYLSSAQRATRRLSPAAVALPLTSLLLAGLVNASVLYDADGANATLTLAGPDGKWFGIGFGASGDELGDELSDVRRHASNENQKRHYTSVFATQSPTISATSPLAGKKPSPIRPARSAAARPSYTICARHTATYGS